MTIGEALALTTAQLAASGIESPRREARLLVALAAALGDAVVLGYPERSLPDMACARLAALAARRAAREPVARLVGRREFWSLDIALSPDTLVPRPDSETLVAAALERLPDRAAPLHLLDLGTGSGCLLLALLSELPNAIGFGVDRAAGAAAQARRNATSNHLGKRAFFLVGDWGAAVGAAFDVVIANPPYIPTAAIAGLMPEVARFDPVAALDGGCDGLTAYRALAPALPRLVRPGGFAVVELGEGQEATAATIFSDAGLDVIGRRCDLAGKSRCLLLEGRPQAKKLLEYTHFPSRVALT